MIGEIRDYETAQIAIQASLTGHLVLATVHTNDAPSTVTRMIDMGVEPFLLSSSLIGVLAQRLVRKLCLACRKTDARGHWHPVGCAACAMTGYKGRTGVYELMDVGDEIRNLIHGRAAEAKIARGRPGGRPEVDARGRRAPGRRRHHLARRGRPGHARVITMKPDGALLLRGGAASEGARPALGRPGGRPSRID